jgi:hypothetical protein
VGAVLGMVTAPMPQAGGEEVGHRSAYLSGFFSEGPW